MTANTPVPAPDSSDTLTTAADYDALYKRSVDDPESFWAEQAQRLDWIKPFTRVKDVSYAQDDLHIHWFDDGVLNVSANCIDRHLAEHGDDVAIIWEGDDPAVDASITFKELHGHVCRLANGLKQLGVSKGDVVTLYMPMVPEAAYAMLACARIGAVHSVVFGGFSPEALAGRIQDCKSRFVITADEGLRGGKPLPLKANVDAAVEIVGASNMDSVLVLERTGGDVAWNPDLDVRYGELVGKQSADCPPEPMNAEDPLFILYTSGSTGKPKGVLHTTGGYLLYAAFTHERVCDYKRGEVYGCTADVGLITGHSYIVYGTLVYGGTTMMFE
ncbi:AMP-binding protein, partial [bacterium]|nr:AMP-binding protein [bacterium]